MNIPWEMLFELIASLIEMCMAKGTSEDRIRKSIANPSKRDLRMLRIFAWRQGFDWWQCQAISAQAEKEAEKVTGDVLDKLFAAAA